MGEANVAAALYPTRYREPMITSLFPILATPDLDRALRFYRDLLGGTVAYEFPGPDGVPAYVGLDLGSSHLGIGLEAGVVAAPRPRPISLWVYTDDCDALVERLRSVGVTITEEPADQPWGERVARSLDPDGNEVVIGQAAAA
jgi:lactoylglutathione lyase